MRYNLSAIKNGISINYVPFALQKTKLFPIMRILKIIGIVLLSILLIVVVVGYLQPSTIQVKADRVIKAPICVIYDHVNDLEKRILWSPWVNQDTTMKITWGDTREGLNASYSWTSQAMGEGTLTYTEAVENEKLVADLQFGPEGSGTGTIYFNEAEDGVQVTWELVSDLGNNPFNRLFGIFIKIGVNQSFIMGLESLDKTATADTENPCLTGGSSQEAPSLADQATVIKETPVEGLSNPIVEMRLPISYAIGILDSSSMENTGATMEKNYGQLAQYLQSNQMAFIGAPLAMYHKYEPPHNIVFTCAMPVADAQITEQEGIELITFEEQLVIRGTHLGAYEAMEPTWNTIDEFVNENGFELVGSPFEEYITDPTMVADTSSWITHIYYPVRHKS